MESKIKIDLKQHTPKKVSKKYLIMVILYVLGLASVGYLFFSKFNKSKKLQNIEIHSISIEEPIEE